MNTSTTLQYFNYALMSGQLVLINANRAIELIPTLTSNLHDIDIFIQNLCNFLNSNNIILNGSIGDIEIITNYIYATETDAPTAITDATAVTDVISATDAPTAITDAAAVTDVISATDAPTAITDATAVTDVIFATDAMGIANTQQFLDLAHSSGHLSQKIIDISGSSESSEWFINTMAHFELRNAFIRGLYRNLSFYNILLTGKDHDMRIIAEYVIINYNDSIGEIEMVD